MEEDCKNEKYEQFDTMDIEDEEKDHRHKKKNAKKYFLYPNKIIKLLFLSVSLLCILFLLYHYLNKESNNIMPGSLEHKNEGNQLEVTLPKKCEIGYKLVDNACVINHSIKAIYFTKEDNERIKLILFQRPEIIQFIYYLIFQK